MRNSLRVLSASWVVPVSRPAIREGAVVVRGGIVEWVGRMGSLPAAYVSLPIERQRGILTPGLVNAHTHLQYTVFAPLGRKRHDDFEQWSAEFEELYLGVQNEEVWRTASRRGAHVAIAAGTTTVAEIVTDDAARGALAEVGLGGIEYLEAIGETTRTWAGGGREAFLARLASPSAGSPVGISPHAPYSLDASVIAELRGLAQERGMRLHAHVGESSQETALYASGEPAVLEIYGELRDEFALVRRHGVGLSTARYAEQIGLLGSDAHIAHAVYLDHDDREIVRASGTRVVLCPRSNDTIGLQPPPVAAYLDEGHELAIGTDSLASAPSLDVLADAAVLAELASRQGYDRDDVHHRLIEAATRGGARALGRADIGALEPGMRADLAVFAVETQQWPERALVTEGAGTCVLTVAGGRTLVAGDAVATGA